MSFESEKPQSAEGGAGSRWPLSASLKGVRQALGLGRGGHYVTQSLRKHPYGWMSSVALVGWVLLSRLPTKKQTADALPSGKKSPEPGRQNGKATPKLLSLVQFQ